MLLDSPLLRCVDDKTTAEKYQFLSKVWTQDWYCLDSCSFMHPIKFTPYVRPKDLSEFIRWVNKNIVLKLADFDCVTGYKTLGVLLRIATDMLNKVDLPDDLKRDIHTNMIWNIQNEMRLLEVESLPFLGVEDWFRPHPL